VSGEEREGRGWEGKGGERGLGEGREDGDGRSNPKPAATGIYISVYPSHESSCFDDI